MWPRPSAWPAEAGLVGGSIEDFTGDKSQPFYDLGLAVERIAAPPPTPRALPSPFTLTARCENFLRGNADLDDTIARLRAYEAAGADVLFAPGLPDLDSVRAVCAALRSRSTSWSACPASRSASPRSRRPASSGSASRLRSIALR